MVPETNTCSTNPTIEAQPQINHVEKNVYVTMVFMLCDNRGSETNGGSVEQTYDEKLIESTCQ